MPRDSLALYDATNIDDRRLCHALAETCFKNSRYDFTSGRKGGNFFDIDEFSLSDTGQGDADEKSKWVAECFSRKIKQLTENGLEVDRLVFAERDTGPVGMIIYKDSIGSMTNIDTCFLRPRKRLLRSAFKGRPFRQGEKVALISDVATSGDTIYGAAEKVWQLGGVVSCAIVLYDRLDGAKEYLALYDIDLIPIFDKVSFLNEGLISEDEEEASTNVVQVLGVGMTG
jgi:orotate phosphoribosyltransferase